MSLCDWCGQPLEQGGDRRMELTKTEKPWGHELLLGEWRGWRIKILHIAKGHQLSKQYHRAKVEYMFSLNDETWTFIQPFKIHRPAAREGDVTIVELSKGSDDDIVRLADDYGRVEAPAAEYEVREGDSIQTSKEVPVHV